MCRIRTNYKEAGLAAFHPWIASFRQACRKGQSLRINSVLAPCACVESADCHAFAAFFFSRHVSSDRIDSGHLER
jgi:hypothetical protein